VTLHTNEEIFRQDVAWMKEVRPHLVPKSAVILKIAEVYHVKPGADAGRKIL
jgi:predicted pyridoxine 5'-phosphate oxidase superfamily flavin-nucleotide-binding protein